MELLTNEEINIAITGSPSNIATPRLKVGGRDRMVAEAQHIKTLTSVVNDMTMIFAAGGSAYKQATQFCSLMKKYEKSLK